MQEETNCYGQRADLDYRIFFKWQQQYIPQSICSSGTFKCLHQEVESRDFLGGPVAKTLCSNAGGLGLIPGWGTRSHMPQLKILHAAMKTEDPKCFN